MQLILNITYLEEYISKEAMRGLARAATNRIRNEMKMGYFQSRWVAMNMTALA
jgi:hypothetical protein